MDTETLYKLKYPIGEFEKPAEITTAILNEWIKTISDFSRVLSKKVEKLTDSHLDTPYRLGGWTVRQVVHHCADSHMNAFCRFKLTLTEDSPTIKPYFEALWAELADSREIPVDDSLFILRGLHARWVVLLQSLSTQDLSRIYIHPEHGREFRLDEAIGNYAWHSNHHLAHIKNVVTRIRNYRETKLLHANVVSQVLQAFSAALLFAHSTIIHNSSACSFDIDFAA